MTLRQHDPAVRPNDTENLPSRMPIRPQVLAQDRENCLAKRIAKLRPEAFCRKPIVLQCGLAVPTCREIDAQTRDEEPECGSLLIVELTLSPMRGQSG